MAGTLETIAYAISRGAVRAYLDVLAERQLSIEEKPNDEDRIRARRMHDAVDRVSGGPRDPGPHDSAPGGGGNDGQGGSPAP